MRAIDADLLIEHCMNGIDNEFIPMVEEMPTLDAIPIPKGATNGDIINALFPNETDFRNDFDEDWWNAPYKAESEDNNAK